MTCTNSHGQDRSYYEQSSGTVWKLCCTPDHSRVSVLESTWASSPNLVLSDRRMCNIVCCAELRSWKDKSRFEAVIHRRWHAALANNTIVTIPSENSDIISSEGNPPKFSGYSIMQNNLLEWRNVLAWVVPSIKPMSCVINCPYCIASRVHITSSTLSLGNIV